MGHETCHSGIWSKGFLTTITEIPVVFKSPFWSFLNHLSLILSEKVKLKYWPTSWNILSTYSSHHWTNFEMKTLFLCWFLRLYAKVKTSCSAGRFFSFSNMWKYLSRNEILFYWDDVLFFILELLHLGWICYEAIMMPKVT